MSLEKGVFMALKEGAVSVPCLLLQWYARLGLSETDMMVLIHLLAFKEKEQTDFPTIDEIQSRMSANPEKVIESIQMLMSEGWMTIDEEIDPQSGIQYERYNLTPLYEKLADVFADFYRSQSASNVVPLSQPDSPKDDQNLFVMFEKEFGRPLSPMECESIIGWLDKDKYPEDLIIAALKESVFAGKVHFRYIDRILLEWARNQIRTPELAKEYASRFRGGS